MCWLPRGFIFGRTLYNWALRRLFDYPPTVKWLAPSYALDTPRNRRPHLEEFNIMAESYQAAKAETPEVLNGLDIYFFVADFSQNQMSFQQVSHVLFDLLALESLKYIVSCGCCCC